MVLRLWLCCRCCLCSATIRLGPDLTHLSASLLSPSTFITRSSLQRQSANTSQFLTMNKNGLLPWPKLYTGCTPNNLLALKYSATPVCNYLCGLCTRPTCTSEIIIEMVLRRKCSGRHGNDLNTFTATASAWWNSLPEYQLKHIHTNTFLKIHFVSVYIFSLDSSLRKK